ncbi:MAG TPA: ATP-dependent DNA helicase, partial [Thermoplasmatales archaeon]|nr:ATP-dependent DNA helicase [Thermoplasmatales archaeon]HEX08371.1 ATP-dependent DNA helicase [Thermoplasmatales archaeon]
MRMKLFPYTLRKNQKEIMQTIVNTLSREGHFVFESSTGSGKTICALAATLEFALQHNKKIIYATRTHAQQRQVILELREIRKKNKDLQDRLFGIGLQGRAHMCLLAKEDPELRNGTAEELSRFCSAQKKKTLKNREALDGKGCNFFKNLRDRKDDVDEIIEWCKKSLPTSEDFVTHCWHKQLCPYELSKMIAPDAMIIVVPYIYVFDPSIRIMLLDWLSVTEEDIILVVDEAHNLPDYVRDLFSAGLSIWSLRNAIYETERYGNPSLLNGRFKISEFCNTLINIIEYLRDKYLTSSHSSRENGDALIREHELEEEILSRLNINSFNLDEIIHDLIAYGENVCETREEEGRIPRSFIKRTGSFLDFWFNLESEQYIKLITAEPNKNNPRLEAYCLDPSVGTNIVNNFHSSIHMSGTLEPLEEYRDSIGLIKENTELVSYPPTFPIENRRILYVRDVTTRYEEINTRKEIVKKIMSHIISICNNFDRNTIVFFPSFDVLSRFLQNNIINTLKRGVYVEKREMTQIELMDMIEDFKFPESKNGSILFSVIGGRISEGMDFPAEQLEIVIIVGIPYPRPTAKQRGLQRYYDIKFGKGWEYTVEAPTARKLMQAIGRLIRNKDDKGVAIILDRRAARFRKYIKDLKESKNLLEDINSFYSL